MPGSTKGAYPTRTFRCSEFFANLAGAPGTLPRYTGRSFPPAHLNAETYPTFSSIHRHSFPVVHSSECFDENTFPY
jgi:hypothetical protein